MNRLILGTMLAGCLCMAGCATHEPRRPGTPDQSKLPSAPQIGRQKEALRPVEHFCFDYTSEPNPGKRIWVRVDESTWVELYPNGTQSRYRFRERAVVGGMSGTVVRKFAGDPNETWTPNDGSFEVFIPDRGNPRLILGFRHFQDGQWQEWQPLALIHPIE